MTWYRKKPVVVDAEQFFPKVLPWPRGVYSEVVTAASLSKETSECVAYYVTTIHGWKSCVCCGDWIVIEPDGIHAYPCKPDIFEATYEPVND